MRPQVAQDKFRIDNVQATAALSGDFSLRTFLLVMSKESARKIVKIVFKQHTARCEESVLLSPVGDLLSPPCSIYNAVIYRHMSLCRLSFFICLMLVC